MKFAIIQILPFLNNPKDVDPSFKMDLDFWDCFGKKNLRLITEEMQYQLNFQSCQCIKFQYFR